MMMNWYELYYVAKVNRLESMITCSLNSSINWCEDGLRIVSWSYNMVASGKSESIEDVFRKYSHLNIDRRRKKQIRSICIGDVIVFDGVPWIVTGFGFSQIPDFLWKKVIDNAEKGK